MSLETLAPLLRLPRGMTQVISFQQGIPPEGIAGYGWDDALPEGCSWEDTLCEMRKLDLLVTVDTAVAHLAGTIGLPTYLMLCAVPDWRWGIEGAKTPFYPSFTMFRQKKLGDWTPVLEDISKHLISA